VLIPGLVLLPADEAEAGDRATGVARTEQRVPLTGRLGEHSRLDRLGRHQRILGHAFVADRLLEESRLAQLGPRHLRRLERLDTVSLGIGHDRKRVPVRESGTITRDTFGLSPQP